MKERKENPVINTTVGKPFDIILMAMSGSTGYGWYVGGMPEGLILFGMKMEPVFPPPTIGPTRYTFTFTAARKGKFTLEFDLLQAWEPTEPSEKLEYSVVVSEKAEVGLESHLGSDRFVSFASHMEHAGPLPPYGFPHGHLGGIEHTIHILYGFPPERMVNVIEDAQRCVVLYGTPWGIANNLSHCLLKYGFPIGLNVDDLETCIVKYGFPKKVVMDEKNCVVKYGTPGGIALDKNNCVMPYGFPVKE